MQCFESLDYVYDDWVVMSSVDYNFNTPKRIGGEFHFCHEDNALLLKAFSFENSGIITYYSNYDGMKKWGFYGREWNSRNNNWDSSHPLFTGSDLEDIFGSQKADDNIIYFGRYLPVFVDPQRQMYLVIQQDEIMSTKSLSNPWFIQIDLETHTIITMKEIPIFTVVAHCNTKSNLVLAGNSTNIVIQLKTDIQHLLVHYNGYEFSSKRRLPFDPAQWRSLNNGELILGGFDVNHSIFRAYTILEDDWVRKEFNLNTNWDKIIDWEISNDKDIHIIAETPNGLEYAVLNEDGVQIRDLGELKLKNMIDISLTDNGSVYLGGMNYDDNLGVVKLSQNKPFQWYEATGWNSLTECGYPDCNDLNVPIMLFEEGILACVFILSLKRHKKQQTIGKNGSSYLLT